MSRLSKTFVYRQTFSPLGITSKLALLSLIENVSYSPEGCTKLHISGGLLIVGEHYAMVFWMFTGQ